MAETVIFNMKIKSNLFWFALGLIITVITVIGLIQNIPLDVVDRVFYAGLVIYWFCTVNLEIKE